VLCPTPHNRVRHGFPPLLPVSDGTGGGAGVGDPMTRRLIAADVWPGSFRAWVMDQQHRDDPMGDLARDLAADRSLGQVRTPQGILRHLQAADAWDGNLAAFRRALKEWQSPPVDRTHQVVAR